MQYEFSQIPDGEKYARGIYECTRVLMPELRVQWLGWGGIRIHQNGLTIALLESVREVSSYLSGIQTGFSVAGRSTIEDVRRANDEVSELLEKQLKSREANMKKKADEYTGNKDDADWWKENDDE